MLIFLTTIITKYFFGYLNIIQFPFLVAVPVVGAAVVPATSIAFENLNDRLILDRDTLTLIFTGNITQWRDSRILNLNPKIDAQIPNASITVIVRGESSGTTNLFTNALSLFDPVQWPFGAVNTWPAPLLSLPNVQTVKGNAGVAVGLEQFPNAIGYIAFPFLASADQVVKRVDLINKAGNVIDAGMVLVYIHDQR
jgi:ABC-type phosphate transport system substrate-binding protein